MYIHIWKYKHMHKPTYIYMYIYICSYLQQDTPCWTAPGASVASVSVPGMPVHFMYCFFRLCIILMCFIWIYIYIYVKLLTDFLLLICASRIRIPRRLRDGYETAPSHWRCERCSIPKKPLSCFLRCSMWALRMVTLAIVRLGVSFSGLVF